SKTVFANGLSVGRVGDIVSCGFKVIKGSENVFAG
ncbi:PAAR domain-containing protein, partial [Wolbachia endosymbiont of Nomada ferruginata]